MAQKKKNKRQVKRRKPKVYLNNKSVIKLSILIVLLCALFLILNFAFTNSSETKNKEKEVIVKTEKKLPVRVNKQEEKKSSQVSSQSQKIKTEEKKSSSSVQQNDTVKNEKTEKQSSKSQSAEKKSYTQKIESEKLIASIPKDEQKLPEKYNIPPAKNGAKIAFVIDDAGLNVANLKKYTSLPFKLTIAVLPKLSHTKDCAYVVRSSGQELILHQPMQSLNMNLFPGPGAIMPDMNTYEIAQLIKENLSELGPNVKGMNNHEGSLISENEIKIGVVLDVAFENNIYFLDSRTTAGTKAPQAALERDMTIYERDVFIDDIVNRDEMLKQIYRGLDIANKKGKVIMIGHVDKSARILPDLLRDMYPYLKANGYTLTSVSNL